MANTRLESSHDSLSTLNEPVDADLSLDKPRFHEAQAEDDHTLFSEKVIVEDQDNSQDGNDTSHSGEDLERTVTQRRPVVEIPRARRRGLFARFAVISEVTQPVDYPNSKKWLITFVVALCAAAAPVGSAIIFPTLEQVVREFDSSPTVANLSVALYMLSMAIFPLWWSSFSETFGRRSIYVVSFALYIVFSVLSAISRNIAMLVVMRMLAGGAAASVQAVGAGTIADVWEVRERGKAMSTFYLGPLCGPLLAPIVGGVLGQAFDWRATQWAQAVFGVIVWIGIFFMLPETLKSTKNLSLEVEAKTVTRPPLTRTSTKQSVQQQSLKWIRIAKMIFIDPLKVIAYLRFPAVLLTVYYASVTFGTLYVLNVSIQYTFEKPPYNFSTIILGLLYLPNSFGYFLASLVGGRWIDHIMKREAIKANRVSPDGKLMFRPEDRMRENAWLGAFLYPCALIWYGWTTEYGVFWLAPMIANFVYGIGSMLIFAMAVTMLTEFLSHKSSSGVALNNLIRNIFSCVGAIVGAPVISAIGNGWLFTILGIWAAVSGILVIWAMKRFGPAWRKNMDLNLR